LNHNILAYLKNEQKYVKLLGQYSLIYSIGLADYVPSKILQKLISFWFSLLLPGGSLVLAHKDRTKYEPISIDWWANWTFFPRDEKDFLNLITESSIEEFDLKIEREPSGVIFFVTITKK